MKGKTKIFLGAALCAVAILAGVFVKIFRKPSVAFYGLDERQKRALLELKVFKNSKNQVAFNFVELDATLPLDVQLKKSGCDLLFAFESEQLRQCVEPLLKSKSAKCGIDQRFIQSYTEVAKNAAQFNQDQVAVKVPLLNDFVAFAADSNFTNEFGYEDFNSLGDVERYLRRCKNYIQSPFVFAGAEEGFVLDLLGIFTESVVGAESYGRAVRMCQEYCRSSKRDAVELVTMLCVDEENSPLYEGAKRLSEWYKSGYFSKDAFSMKHSDIFEFMRIQSAPLVLISLSQRRTAIRDTIKRYSYFFVPSEHYGARAFVSPILFGVCFSKNGAALDALSRLALTEMQEIFSSQSGLAPLEASCKTADRQANDVRYWLGASAMPLAGLYAEGFLDREFGQKVCDAAKNIIVNF